MLDNREKRLMEKEMMRIIDWAPRGIDTRVLIDLTMTNIRKSVSNCNKHHIAGMIAWLMSGYSYKLIVRTPGYSVIVKGV